MLPNRRSLSPFGTGTPACMHLLCVTSTTDAARMLSADQTENEILLIIEQFQIQIQIQDYRHKRDRHKISKYAYMNMIYQSFLKGFFFNYIPKKNINFFFIK